MMLQSPSAPLPANLTPAEPANAPAPPILLQYWHVALRWKWVILGIIVGVLALGTVTTLLMTKQYTATARVEISREQKNITKVEGLDSQQAGRDLEFYQTQYSLLRARSLTERVARKLRLASDPSFFAAHGVEAEGGEGIFGGRAGPLSKEEREKREKLTVDLLLEHLDVAPIRGSSLVDINYTSALPALSATIANTWTQEFVGASVDRRFESTADARRFLEERLAGLRAKLETSERELVNYASDKDIVTLSRTQGADGRTESERTLVAADLEALNAALNQATADRITAQSKAHPRQGGSSAEALGNQAIAQLRQKRAEVAADYAKLLVQFEPGYPAARALNEQLRTLDASIAREEARVTNSRASEFQESVAREQSLLGKVTALKQRLDQQQRANIQYKIYQRDADTNRQLYDALLQRYKEIGVAGVGANNIAIVDSAQVPDKPSSPNLLVNLALSLLAGLVLAGIAIFALEQIDEGLRDPSQVNRLLNAPLLGSVPDIESGNAIEMLGDPKSMLSESYFSIRSNLAFSTDHGMPRTMMVTSTKPAEGKSTTSFALAAVLGRIGKKVVVIDADMRSPSMHETFGIPLAPGLSNYLAGEDNWHALIRAVPNKNISVMSAGPVPPSAAELLSGDRLHQLLEEMRGHFDHVVVDSPPILGLADAPLISCAVEGCVFVIEAEGVAVRGVRAALNRLHAVHAHVFGIVVTKLKQRQAGYGYGYAYGYGYGQDETAATPTS